MEKITETEKGLIDAILLRIKWSEISITSALGCLEIVASSLKVNHLRPIIKGERNE